MQKYKWMNELVWLGTWGRVTVKITKYFLNQRWVTPFYNTHFFYFSLWIVFDAFLRVVAANHFLTSCFYLSTLYFPPSINICKTFYLSEREQSAEEVGKVVSVVKLRKKNVEKELVLDQHVGSCTKIAVKKSYVFSLVFTSMLCWISYAVQTFCYDAYFDVFNKCSF